MKVEIYTKDACPYCVQAKALMKNKGWEFTEHYISADNREKLLEELTTRLGVAPRTVPQIFIDGKGIGGYTELTKWSADKT
jgi:glutaredoxin 3